ncbi:taste receptor type 1 member 2.2 [Nelusetta ayraudi]|uniref:taste receptor type 1 member 2.2 n=1 Tax=Nelusetta ayraudi TaxID=303726 RepID=UPI003F6F9492
MAVTTMKYFFPALCFLVLLLHALAQCDVPASEFHRDGDYLLGGLFDVHHASTTIHHHRPETIDCSSQTFTLSSYRRFQLMRFTVEEINNSTKLLPNVALGYEIFDQCSNTHSFPSVLKFISINDLIQPWVPLGKNVSKMIAVVGPFSSTSTLTVAPLLMMNLFPVVSYGAGSSVFTQKAIYPSFLRTVHSNKDVIEVIVRIILNFGWRWVSFLNSDDAFGKDGLELFRKRIADTDICLGYAKDLSTANTNYSQIFQSIEAQKIGVIVVFTPKLTAEALIGAAMQLNVTNKVWIAGDTWSLNKKLPKERGIKNIGTVIGISQPVVAIPGFSDFIYSARRQSYCENSQTFCNQFCNCGGLTAEDILAVDPSYSFSVYSAVYALAHALHKTMQCASGTCNRNTTVYPYKVFAELKKSSFKLLNQTIQFDENGEPTFGSYSLVFWNQSGNAEEIGFYKFYPAPQFLLNSTKIQWYTKGKVPTSLCSPECHTGYVKKQTGNEECCFSCDICEDGTYINSTEDPYTCVPCKEAEWSAAGSTSCLLRAVEYVAFTDTESILIIIGACALVLLTVAMSVVFAINYNTPIVRSAGGPMCFLILGCLSLCNISVFFYFGEPTSSFCTLRILPFVLFYTVCLACFVVRSFQIVCIFKIAAKIPKLHSWWMKYHGQWLVIAAALVTQAFLLVIGYSNAPPKPYNDTVWYPDKIILTCDMNMKAALCSVVLLGTLCCLCFIFSYMGKDLPKNYNEAKSVTFCLLLLILTWTLFTSLLMLYRGKHIQTFNALSVLSSLYAFLFWYFLPKCYIIIFQPQKNTQKYFQSLIQNYTKTISQ